MGNYTTLLLPWWKSVTVFTIFINERVKTPGFKSLVNPSKNLHTNDLVHDSDPN